MPLNSSNNLPKSDIPLNRENSLPTYDEATGRFRQDESADVAPSAPVLPAESQQYYVDDDRRTNYHTPNRTPISQAPYRPRDQDVERALQDRSMLQHEDPVVREMAQTVLAECRRAKEKREMKAVMNVCGFFFVIVIVIIMLAVKGANNR